ncbi:MAG TPA: insulinase family protein [Sunxiuqinia sp.]|nr:insulinase family protein [Sunxiuqinia sp.]
MKQLISIVFLLVVLSVSAQTKLDPSRPLPEDPAVNKGVLPNGLTYYVRANDTPKNRADLFLVVRAGSVDEDNDQQGFAHLAEHMAFNGTKNFPKHELVNYLESIGMEFGADVNAHTGFDKTVYTIKVPLDSTQFINKGLQVLYDWASQITDSNEEIEKERGVVHEEWRRGRGANQRMLQEWLPVVLPDSRYAERLPIGKIDIIDHGSPDALRRFRHDWYRPDLEAVIVVGDFDQAKMTEKVKEMFSKIPKREEERPKKIYDIPNNKKTLVSIVTDKEARYTEAQVGYKHPLEIQKTVGDYRESIKESLFNGMINNRLQELLQKKNPPFIYASSSYGAFIGPKSAYFSDVYTQNGEIEKGLKSVLEENQRVKEYGFTSTELERQKKAMMASMEKAYNERDKQKSINYANEYERNFSMTEEPFPGITNEYKYYQEFLPTIKLDEVNQLADKWITDSNRVVIITAPKIDSIKMPTDEQVLTLMKQVEQERLKPYDDKVSDKPLISGPLKSGTITETKKLKAVGATEWKLSNGATVVVKPTDFKDDEILFSAYSLGGNSQYGLKDDVSADVTSSVVSMSGISDFDNVTLSKMLSDKVFSISPYIGELTEGFKGNSSKKDVETLLSMLHLYFTNIRVDTTAFSSFMTQMKGALQNKKVSPEAAFRDTFQVVSSDYNPRKKPLDLSSLSEANFTRIKEIAKQRFSDASDFKFFFVGNIDLDKFKPLVEKYIGSIPSSHKSEMWKDLGIHAPKGVVNKTVYKGEADKGNTYIVFHGNFDYTLKNRIILDDLQKIMGQRLIDVIREDKSSSYSPGAHVSFDKYPEPVYRFMIYYGSDPKKEDELKSAIFDIISDIQKNGPSAEDLEKATEKQLREREVNMRENGFWLSVLSNYFLYDNGDFNNFDNFDKLVKEVDAKTIQEAAKKYLNFDDYYRVSLKPAKDKPEASN